MWYDHDRVNIYNLMKADCSGDALTTQNANDLMASVLPVRQALHSGIPKGRWLLGNDLDSLGRLSPIRTIFH